MEKELEDQRRGAKDGSRIDEANSVGKRDDTAVTPADEVLVTLLVGQLSTKSLV